MAYSSVYSSGFLYYTESTPNTQYLVPEGFTAVIRDFLVWTEIGSVNAWVAVALAPGAPFVNFASLNIPGVNASGQWQGRVVCPAGSLIGIAVGELGPNDTAYVGGYLLRDVTP